MANHPDLKYYVDFNRYILLRDDLGKSEYIEKIPLSNYGASEREVLSGRAIIKDGPLINGSIHRRTEHRKKEMSYLSLAADYLNIFDFGLSSWLSNVEIESDIRNSSLWPLEVKQGYIKDLLTGLLTVEDRTFHLNQPSNIASMEFKHAFRYDDFIIIDGCKRFDAILSFLKDEVPIDGKVFTELYNLEEVRKQFWDGSVQVTPDFPIFFVTHFLQTREDIMQWYIKYNDKFIY